jgi:hypothetical protein
MLPFNFLYGVDDAGQWRWAIAGPDGTTALAYCAGPSKSKRACLAEIAVVRQFADELPIVQWKAPRRRRRARGA